MKQTSVEAFHAIKDTRTDLIQHYTLLRFIRKVGPCTAYQAGIGSGIGEHNATRRFTELRQKGWIHSAGRVKNPTGRSALTYTLTPEGYQALVMT